MNFGVVDNFPYPPFVTHSTLTSPEEGKEKRKIRSLLPTLSSSKFRSPALRNSTLGTHKLTKLSATSV